MNSTPAITKGIPYEVMNLLFITRNSELTKLEMINNFKEHLYESNKIGFACSEGTIVELKFETFRLR